MAERDIVAAIVRSAKRQGWWTLKIHGGPYQPPGIPDLLLAKDGKAVWFEVKQPGKKPTAIQVRRMAEIEKQAGTPCYVVTSKEEADELLGRHSDNPKRAADDPAVLRSRRAVLQPHTRGQR